MVRSRFSNSTIVIISEVLPINWGHSSLICKWQRIVVDEEQTGELLIKVFWNMEYSRKYSEIFSVRRKYELKLLLFWFYFSFIVFIGCEQAGKIFLQYNADEETCRIGFSITFKISTKLCELEKLINFCNSRKLNELFRQSIAHYAIGLWIQNSI